MAGLRLHSPMLHPEHYCSQRRVRGQSQWLVVLCKTLSFSIPSRFIPALSLTTITAAVVGVILNLALWFGWHAVWPNGWSAGMDGWVATIGVIAFAALQWGRIALGWIVLGAALAGWGLRGLSG